MIDALLILADRTNPEVTRVLDALESDLPRWARSIEHRCTTETDQLPDALQADRAIVIGGDGAMIGQARRLIGRDIPIIGINCGRLGFLAPFDADSLHAEADTVFGDDPPVRRHMVMNVKVKTNATAASHAAVNDAVIMAGPPYRMIELAVRIGGVDGPDIRGDGMVVATPTGSTAHNLSAGGPIIGPGVDALVVTGLSPQSLAFRPIVLAADEGVELEVVRGSGQAPLVIDGQLVTTLAEGDRIAVTRHRDTVPFVVRSSEPFPTILQERMRWAISPRFR